MSDTIKVTVPDIGDFSDVPVIEVLVSPGDSVSKEQSLVTLESEKATMEVPSPAEGVVETVHVSEGDNVSEGTLIVTLAGEGAAPSSEAEAPAAEPAKPEPAAPAPQAASDSGQSADFECDVMVLGSGPGGYTAAFRAADLGLNVVLVERYESIGGVCLNVGCIPSKALLHSAKVIDEAADMAKHGVSFGDPQIDLDTLRGWKDGVVGQLTKGLAGMSKQRKVTIVTGEGQFASPNELIVQTAEGDKRVRFKNAIIAAGSRVIKLPIVPWDDPRVMDSTDALELGDIPDRLLVIGGGIIGLEMACVYQALGAKVTVVELMDQLMPGADKDLVRPLQKRVQPKYENIFLKTKVTRAEASDAGIQVWFEGDKAPETDTFDRVLMSVGRRPNGDQINAEAAGVAVDERGFIAVDAQQRTNVGHIFAIGDIVGQPMLAHKATHEGKVAAEVCAGEKSAFDARCIPSVAYTDPEVAWVGVTETEAKEKGINFGKGAFPWAASGRALGIARPEGMTKLLFDEDSGRVIGMGAVGPNAGDLIAEGALAIEMGCEAADIGLTVHPHPTLSETVGMAAEAYEGTITDLYMPKKK